jgi:hypothetical protein
MMRRRNGIVPVPVVALLAIMACFLRLGKLPTEIRIMIAVIAVIAVGGCPWPDGGDFPAQRHPSSVNYS